MPIDYFATNQWASEHLENNAVIMDNVVVLISFKSILIWRRAVNYFSNHLHCREFHYYLFIKIQPDDRISLLAFSIAIIRYWYCFLSIDAAQRVVSWLIFGMLIQINCVVDGKTSQISSPECNNTFFALRIFCCFVVILGEFYYLLFPFSVIQMVRLGKTHNNRPICDSPINLEGLPNNNCIINCNCHILKQLLSFGEIIDNVRKVCLSWMHIRERKKNWRPWALSCVNSVTKTH